jgi:hypothetical protein
MEERSSSEGAHRKGVDGGDAQAEFSVEKGFRWWKVGKADVWAVGEACAALGRGRARQMVRGGKNRLVAPFKGRWGTTERGGGSGSRDATRHGARGAWL